MQEQVPKERDETHAAHVKKQGFDQIGALCIKDSLCLGNRLLALEETAGARFAARLLVAADSPSARATTTTFIVSHVFVLVDPIDALESLQYQAGQLL
jgi:hypothetical protein